jgi:hypothetical protein
LKNILKINKTFIKISRKKLEIKIIRIKLKKNYIWQIGIEGLNLKEIKLLQNDQE